MVGVNTELSPAQRADWLRLIRTDNVGPATFRRLLNRFGSAAAALEALPRLSSQGGRSAPLKSPSPEAIADELEGIERLGARLVAMGEPDYPALLSYIPGAPPMLTVRGGDNLDWRKTVGIVGARNASAAGQRMTKLVAGDLGDAGYVIVSGLARGIDAAAHTATLASGTIAVLAGGLDRIYPETNMPLAEEIVAHGGALVSEMPLGWEPRARDFPRRNRIVSGLSLGVVVIEAAKRSGSLITARMALEQNREVFAVPGSPLDPRSEGANSLIRDGATLINGASDIIESLVTADPSRTTLFEDDDDQDFAFVAMEGHVGDEPSNDDRTRLIEALSITPVAVDELIQQTGIPASSMQMMLIEFDLAGRIEWSSGQLVSLRQ